MIVDSSVWVDFLARKPSAIGRSVRSFLESGGTVFLTTNILQEVLQGARDQAHLAALNRVLSAFPLCEPSDPREVARKAGDLYAHCRWKGVTIRSSNDCMIAAVAIDQGQPVMTLDRDFHFLRSIDPSLQLVDLPVVN